MRPLPRAYEQLHGDSAATDAAAAAASLPAGAYDMYDTIAIDSLDDLRGSLMDPDVAAALYEDELGHVDHASLRGALQRVVAAWSGGPRQAAPIPPSTGSAEPLT